jgi:hypothetical protein
MTTALTLPENAPKYKLVVTYGHSREVKEFYLDSQEAKIIRDSANEPGQFFKIDGEFYPKKDAYLKRLTNADYRALYGKYCQNAEEAKKEKEEQEQKEREEKVFKLLKQPKYKKIFEEEFLPEARKKMELESIQGRSIPTALKQMLIYTRARADFANKFL